MQYDQSKWNTTVGAKTTLFSVKWLKIYTYNLLITFDREMILT